MFLSGGSLFFIWPRFFYRKQSVLRRCFSESSVSFETETLFLANADSPSHSLQIPHIRGGTMQLKFKTRENCNAGHQSSLCRCLRSGYAPGADSCTNRGPAGATRQVSWNWWLCDCVWLLPLPGLRLCQLCSTTLRVSEKLGLPFLVLAPSGVGEMICKSSDLS